MRHFTPKQARRAERRDTVENPQVKYLLELGFICVKQPAGSGCDYVCAWRGKMAFVEWKSKLGEPLTEIEAQLRAECDAVRVPYIVAVTMEEVVSAFETAMGLTPQ